MDRDCDDFTMKRRLFLAYFLFAAILLSLAERQVWAAWGTDINGCVTQDEASSSTTLTCTMNPGENLEVDKVGILVCSGDNVTAADGNSNDHGTVTDSAGNTWTKAYEFTEGTGGVAAGPTVSVHFAKVNTQLTGGSSTITCNYNTAVMDRAMHLTNGFTIGAGNTVSVVGTPQGEASNGGD